MSQKLSFNCPNCNETNTAYFFNDDKVDVVHCVCGKHWTVIKPIDTKCEEDN